MTKSKTSHNSCRHTAYHQPTHLNLTFSHITKTYVMYIIYCFLLDNRHGSSQDFFELVGIYLMIIFQLQTKHDESASSQKIGSLMVLPNNIVNCLYQEGWRIWGTGGCCLVSAWLSSFLIYWVTGQTHNYHGHHDELKQIECLLGQHFDDE